MGRLFLKKPWARAIAAASCLLLAAGISVAYEPTSRYVVKDIEGWQVYVHRDLLGGGKRREIGEPALRQLKYGLAKVRQMVAAGPLEKLQKVKIWLEVDSTNGKHGRTSGYQYHPDLDWLEKMDFNPGKQKCVEFGTAAGLAKRADFQTVQVTMHELAHAYHDQVLSFENPDVLAAHKRAGQEGKYPPNDWVVRANHKEFFAGLTTRYFESEERRKEIVERDPVFAKKLEQYWGKPKALFNTPPGDCRVSGNPDAVRGNTVMWYRQPGESWTESLPLGNGRLGALVSGKVGDEVIHLNEDTFWAGGPYTQCSEEGGKHIAEIRRLVFEKKYRQAHDLFNQTMLGKPVEQLKYLPLCDLELSFPFQAHIDDYRRELDLATGVAKVRYKAGGVTYTREVFVSPADQVIAVHLSADKPGAVDGVGVWLQGRTNDRENSGETFVVEQTKDGMVLKGRNCDDRGVAGQVAYQVQLKVIREGGSLGKEGWGEKPRLRIRGADAVTILISAATSFVNYKDVSGDPGAKAGKVLDAAAQKSYQQLRKDSVAEHRRLFGRVEVSMTPTDDAARATDVRMKNFDVADDPQLAALVYQFGRYLLMCSSRPGTQPANLQGIWNPRMNPSWESKYTTNINLEMNYWPAEVGNLGECVGPLEDLIRDIAEGPGALVARKQYNAGGWVLHQNTDIWRASAPMDGAAWGTWTMGGAWVCTHFWEHYLFHPDREYLRRVYPLLKGCCQFFLDTLVEDPEHKWLVTCPSTSPENSPRGREDKSPADENRRVGGTTIAAGPTMDMQILRYLFDSTAKASEILGVDPELRKRLGKVRGRLAPNQIGQHGQLQEWLEDWDSPTDRHRHLSHLWGMYPGNEISVSRTPDLAKAVAKSLEFRGEGGTGFGMTWQMCLWARMFNGEKAFRMFTNNLMQNTYPNLFGNCFSAPQVDGSFGAAAGIAEMLLQSQDDAIVLLPALPRQWPGGRVKGFRARGGFELDFAWEDGRLSALTVRSQCGGPLKIRRGDRGDAAVIELKETKAGESYTFDDRLRLSTGGEPPNAGPFPRAATPSTPPARTGKSPSAGG
jgi:alpha-L-fucosidase 2